MAHPFIIDLRKGDTMSVSILTAVIVLSVTFCPETPLMTYTRPDSSASVFGILNTDESVDITVKTESGWLGFDPGTAQAANTGSFRYRWLPPETISADTGTLKTIWAPKPGITYAMTYEETPVYTQPDSASVLLTTIAASSAAEVTEISGSWLRVNLNESPEPVNLQGWIDITWVSSSRE